MVGKGERPGNSGQAAPGTESSSSSSGGGGRSPLEGGKGTAAVATATTGGAGGQQRRRKRGAVAAGAGCSAPLALAANGTQAAVAAAGGGSTGANSLLLRRGRLKRNLSAAASSSSSPAAPVAAASLGTRSLDRKALLLLPKPPRQLQPLQPPERDWVRRDLQRGCVHVYYYHHHHHHHHQQRGGGGGGGCYLRPVLCTLETTAAEVASRLLHLGHRGGGSSAVRVLGKVAAAATVETRLPHEEEDEEEEEEEEVEVEEDLAAETATAPNGAEEALTHPVEVSTSLAGSLTPIPAGRRPRSRRGTHKGLEAGESARPGRLTLSGGESGRSGGRPSLSPADCSPGRVLPPPPPTELYLAGPPLSCPSLLGGSDTESFSPSAESASDRLDPYSGGGGSSSSSEELEADPAPPLTAAGEEGAGSGPGRSQRHRPGDLSPVHPAEPRVGRAAGEFPTDGKALGDSSLMGEAATPQQPPALYVQLHGETARRLESHEKPLQIQNDYLSQLGFRDLWRVQEEGMDSETGCLIRFYAGG